jgi:hypothetical protein
MEDFVNIILSIMFYDVLGNKVATLVDGYKPAGTYQVEFSAFGKPVSSIQNLASGIFFYHLKTGNFVQTKK